MRLTKVRLQNFLSYKDAEITLSNQGTTLVTGRVIGSFMSNNNGAGKSALLPDSILFALFGATLRGAKGSKVVRKDAGKDCLVTLWGETEDGPFVIRRPQKHTMYSQPEIDWAGDTYRGDAEVRDIVFRYLLGGVGQDTFIAANVFGKGKNSLFFTQLSDSERKKILDEILGFSVLQELEASARSEHHGMVLRLESMIRERATSETLIELHNEKLKEHQIRQASAQQQKMEENARLDERLNRLAAEIVSANKSMKQLAAKAKKAAEDIAKYQIKVDSLKKKAKRFSVTEEEIRTRVRKELDLNTKTKKVKALQELSSQDECPTCYAPIALSKDRLTMLLTEVLDTQVDYEKYVATMEAKQEQESKILSAAESLTDAIDELKRAERDCTSSYQRLEADVAYNKSVIAELYKRKDSLRSFTEPFDELIADSVSSRDKEVARYQDLAGQCTELQYEVEAYARVVETFGNRGLKSFLMEGIIPKLNSYAQHYSNILTEGEITLSFDGQTELASGEKREKISLTISINGKELTYDECSQGQKVRADIITTLALGRLAQNRVGRVVNFVILDEIFEGLDATGLDKVIVLLEELGRERENVFVITHNERLQTYFTNTIEVEYKNGITSIAA